MIVLLGPQQEAPTAPRVLSELGVRGAVALITSGWQEREAEPAVIGDLGVPAKNLLLHARAEEVFASDPELAEAHQARQNRLRSLQDFYRVRLDHAAQAARAISVRHVDAELAAEEHAASRELVRHIDRDHVERCLAAHAAFERRFRPSERPAVRRHAAELAEILAASSALVIAGGHVAVLLNRLRLFDVAAKLGSQPIVAWSAGAMVLTERVVLFHDDPPHGQAISEILDAGLCLVRGLVLLPAARARLDLDDRDRVSQLASRYAPAACVALDAGARITIARRGAARGAGARISIDARGADGAGVARLDESGRIDATWRP